MVEGLEERIYTIPLDTRSVPRTVRAKKAVKIIKSFVARHMKAGLEDVWIDTELNQHVWARGIQKPPKRVKVRAIKFEDGLVEVALPELEATKKKAEEETPLDESAATTTKGTVAEDEAKETVRKKKPLKQAKSEKKRKRK